MSIKLPAVITGCDEYETLAEEERAALVRRLEDALDLGVSLASGERKNGYPDFFQFVEALEQDASHLQEFTLPLVSAVDGVTSATEYGAAMAHQIALDILLGKVLSACYKLRLNGLVPR
ncbi:hypothetical protein FHW69_003841 [Luteibacter sp. Sphag1AF]|uniref:hypothetical protein n=1 Tax=Luteibacter sp. Sphag1AF TaxID=2587031 RepID=UPI00161EE0A5|nr:hypothetical protein [Luteibacter sp. Sphag1AF]MBB3229182.1 hypothetical protein [Luteibacter sp. Sphag1AF]